MKKRLLIVLAVLCFSTGLFSQTNNKQWAKQWTPDYATFQFAGNIGFLSTGIGYQLFSQKLNTELLYGFVPKHNDTKAIHLITLKNTVPLFRFSYENLVFSPSLGLTTTLETGRHSFVFLEDKYPDGYYRSNALHFTFLLALNVHKDFKSNYAIKGMDFYYEISSLDTYFWYGISNKEVKANEIFSSALGVRLFF